MTEIKIRKYKSEDCQAVSKLFFDTVHSVNARDYNKEQLFAWAGSENSLIDRCNDLLRQTTLIAEANGIIAGFCSMDTSGCLDLLFVHKDHQSQGIASALCDQIEKYSVTVKTFASITAKPFFEKRGYKVLNQQKVERSGQKLKNFEMRLN